MNLCHLLQIPPELRSIGSQFTAKERVGKKLRDRLCVSINIEEFYSRASAYPYIATHKQIFRCMQTEKQQNECT